MEKTCNGRLLFSRFHYCTFIAKLRSSDHVFLFVFSIYIQKTLYGLSERIADLQEYIAQKKAELGVV
jgi:cell division protein FtsL